MGDRPERAVLEADEASSGTSAQIQPTYQYTAKLIQYFTSNYQACIGACVAGQADVMLGTAVLLARANGLSARTFRNKLVDMSINNQITFGLGVGTCAMGGSVVWRMMMDYPERFLTVTLVSPGSPYGFGGTKDEDGTPCYPDFAGTGGGLVNPELIQRVKAGDRSLESTFSPRVGMRGLFVEPFIPPREEDLLSSLLSIHIGEQDFPGDSTPSPNSPYVAPGVWGPANAMSPKYAGVVSKIYDGRLRVPVLWIRGRHDQVVSDTSTSDPGFLGKMGLIPGWPGEDVFPPQPMLRQTRAVLEKYTVTGGSYNEVVIQDAAHIPFIEKPEEFNAVFHAHIGGNPLGE